MKILISGYHNPHFKTITEYIEEAIIRLGHQLYVFDDRQYYLPGRLRQKIQWLHELDHRLLNKRMISVAYQELPDIAIITGGHRISAETIRKMKEKDILTILWTIDPPRNFLPILKIAPYYDYIFCQGSEAVDLLDNADIKGAYWLPMGCDPLLHQPVELTSSEKKEYGSDVCFIGSYYPKRAELFEKLVDFNLYIWGPGWENLDFNSDLKKCLKGGQLKPETWTKIYSASKIVLAPHFTDPNDSFPVYQASPRIFEALACGAFTISDNQKDVFRLFKDGLHLVKFHDYNELIKKIKYYLEHPERREYIAKQGQQEVLLNHTYTHRINEMLSLIKKQ